MSALKPRHTVLLLGIGVALGAGGQARGAVLDYTSLVSASQNVATGPFTVTAGPSGGVFDRKTALGASGVGVSGGNSVVAGEIDSSESINVHAASPQQLHGFSVAFLFASGIWGDTVDEMAVVDVISDGSVVASLRLTANHDGGADLSGDANGVVTTISPGTGDGAGAFSVTGLDIGFTDLVFRPGNGGNLSTDGDFSFVNLTTGDPVMVPEPGSFAALGAALLSLTMLGHRRRVGQPARRRLT